MVDRYTIILTGQTKHLKSCADIMVGDGVDAHVVARCNVNTVPWCMCLVCRKCIEADQAFEIDSMN